MAEFFAASGAGANDCRLDWVLDFDDVANTVTITATHTRFDGSPAPDPQVASLTFQLNSGQSISVDLLTGLLSNGQVFSPASPGRMIDGVPKTRTNVRLSLSSGRAKVITFDTTYQPPVV